MYSLMLAPPVFGVFNLIWSPSETQYDSTTFDQRPLVGPGKNDISFSMIFPLMFRPQIRVFVVSIRNMTTTKNKSE